MKKLVSTVATGILIAGVSVSNVSAAEVEVHKGDTLWGIARTQNTTVEELMNVNNLETTMIHPNQILFIDEQYTVQTGDTLSGIAYKFDVAVDDLKSSNNLTSDLIRIGQVLTIKGGNSVEGAPVTNAANHAVSEEPATEPVEEEVSEKPATEPVEEKVSEEPATEPVEEEVSEEPATEPVEKEVSEEPAAEPVEEEVSEEPVTEPAEEDVSEAETVKQVEPKQDVQKDDSNSTKKTTPTNDNHKVKENKAAVKKTEPAKEENKAEGKVINATATAYTAKCNGCSGITSTGVDLNANPNAKVIAVDPTVIPLGSKVYVEGYGYAIAADTGGGIKGNKIDVHVPTKDEAHSWGNRTVKVTIVK